MNKNKKLQKSFANDGFDFDDIHYRPMTMATLSILEMVDSPFFADDDGGNVRGMMDYLFVHSIPVKDARKLSKSKEAWEDAVFDFGDGFSAAELEKLSELISEQNDMIAETVVEVEKKTAKRK